MAQAQLDVYFKRHLLTPKYRPDLLVFSEIVVELKVLCSDHEAQLFNYMRIAHKRVGHLINFGSKGDWEWKRFIIDDRHIPQHR